jgi:hypothetical protein
MPFRSQHGHNGIRFIGGIVPDIYTDGFKLFADNGEVISDFSEYKYFYNDNAYTDEKDEIEYGKGANEPIRQNNSYADDLACLISVVNKKIDNVETELTPYTESKKVYIGDTNVEFDYVKSGNISAWLVVSDTQIPCVYEVIDNKIVVSFDELEEVGTVTISIQ